ncbi:hypothetical protein SDC9_76053 [bioreactor metagenome]|uniref:Uncharacterized protein n=1 Tax=bioreactor metagenome TaxID=1076179 RepID=A0A644YSR1_9ZZZZ
MGVVIAFRSKCDRPPGHHAPADFAVAEHPQLQHLRRPYGNVFVGPELFGSIVVPRIQHKNIVERRRKIGRLAFGHVALCQVFIYLLKTAHVAGHAHIQQTAATPELHAHHAFDPLTAALLDEVDPARAIVDVGQQHLRKSACSRHCCHHFRRQHSKSQAVI